MTEQPPHTELASKGWRRSAVFALVLLSFGVGWLSRDALHGKATGRETRAALGELDTALATFELRHNQEIARLHEELAEIKQAMLAETESLHRQIELTTATTDAQPPIAKERSSITYRVRPGDSLSEIAYSLLGSPLHYRVIAEANHLATPELILPGQELQIPLPLSEPLTTMD